MLNISHVKFSRSYVYFFLNCLFLTFVRKVFSGKFWDFWTSPLTNSCYSLLMLISHICWFYFENISQICLPCFILAASFLAQSLSDNRLDFPALTLALLNSFSILQPAIISKYEPDTPTLTSHNSLKPFQGFVSPSTWKSKLPNPAPSTPANSSSFLFLPSPP